MKWFFYYLLMFAVGCLLGIYYPEEKGVVAPLVEVEDASYDEPDYPSFYPERRYECIACDGEGRIPCGAKGKSAQCAVCKGYGTLPAPAVPLGKTGEPDCQVKILDSLKRR